MKKITLLLLTCASGLLTYGQAARKVVVEDETGSWCGYCPRGRTTAEAIEAQYPNAICIANHSGDTYENTYGKAIDAAVNTYGYPGGMVDRHLFSGSSVVMATNSWSSSTANHLATTAPLAVTISSTYNTSTRLLNVTVNANFVGAASGDMRISCVLVQDSMVNAADPQHNYMGNGCSSPDPSSPWYSSPCSITNYIQRDVSRKNLAPDWGTTGVIPASVTAGQNFSQSYSYTIPASGWTPKNVSIVAFVAKYTTAVTTRDIMNASRVYMGASNATSIFEHPELSSVVVKQNTPNPFKDITALQFRLNKTENVSIVVYNSFGQVVNELFNSQLIPGDHTFYWAGDRTDGTPVTPGVYYYTITTSEGQVSKPMVFVGQ